MGVGSPPTNCEILDVRRVKVLTFMYLVDRLLIDTGSSNTWVGAAQSYVATSTSVNTGNSVAVTYGSGSFSGEECEFDSQYRAWGLIS